MQNDSRMPANDGMMKFLKYYDSPSGRLAMTSDGEFLTCLRFEGGRFYGEIFSEPCGECDLPVFSDAVRWLDIYFSGAEPDFTPALRFPETTGFRRAVWDLLCDIPYGCSVTYGELATRLAAAKGTGGMSARAVGGAVGRNPFEIIVPCHRVVGAGGALTGYSGGLSRKRFLLELEGVLPQLLRP